MVNIEPIDTDGKINVIIETPRGCRNKFKFDEKNKCFILAHVLPAGSSFPYDFGFLPKTKGADGDPIDVLLLMDQPAFPGCLIVARLVGVIEATQTEKGKKPLRNDRLIAVADQAHDYRDIHKLSDINQHLLKELENFFIFYNKMRGTKFELIATRGPKYAMKLLKKSMKK